MFLCFYMPCALLLGFERTATSSCSQTDSVQGRPSKISMARDSGASVSFSEMHLYWAYGYKFPLKGVCLLTGAHNLFLPLVSGCGTAASLVL